MDSGLAGGLLFEVVLQVTDPEDWWQDAGFYGAVSAGATAAVFFKLAMREVPVEEAKLC